MHKILDICNLCIFLLILHKEIKIYIFVDKNYALSKLSTTFQTNDKPILKLENIYKEYHEKKNQIHSYKHVVINKLNLHIREGEFVTIVGPSGCGKSTLLNLVAGLDPIFDGKIHVDEIPINRSPDTDRVVVFQEGALFPWLTVYENIEFGLKIARVPRNKRKEKVLKLIEMVQLLNFTNAYIHQLSGGMKQRVAIARALALDPKILLMDEPFAALDVQTRKILYNHLLRIHEETKKTILFVTHNIHEAVTLGDRVIIMSPKLANIKKQIIVNIPRPRSIDHPLVESITREVISESNDLFAIDNKIAGGDPDNEIIANGDMTSLVR
ncbi:Aliphatic sulfonates import ATP-binding protein SsuB [Candidatus Nitrosocosmicus franklandus]|uniref:Aliphatic sulfonates import ATP-binding protein SsuB n=1 Tax=Candidatus Nitrosocosmicus franklandianus TaxID=1798806 RepID=A0A484IH77_9ARCH|nr:Aliphatic sulfonates import ATP-binding protein SsuB [Candidatus Nitrosocosmicus franklandus]